MIRIYFGACIRHVRHWLIDWYADVWDGLDIFHQWITIDFHDKLSHGNPRVSGGGQVDPDRTGKMSSRKISGKWASAGTRLKRLRRTGGAGGIVSPNASFDAGWTRNQDPILPDITRVRPGYQQSSKEQLRIAYKCEIFYRPDALPVTQPTASKHWGIIALLQDGFVKFQQSFFGVRQRQRAQLGDTVHRGVTVKWGQNRSIMDAKSAFATHFWLKEWRTYCCSFNLASFMTDNFSFYITAICNVLQETL